MLPVPCSVATYVVFAPPLHLLLNWGVSDDIVVVHVPTQDAYFRKKLTSMQKNLDSLIA